MFLGSISEPLNRSNFVTQTVGLRWRGAGVGGIGGGVDEAGLPFCSSPERGALPDLCRSGDGEVLWCACPPPFIIDLIIAIRDIILSCPLHFYFF